MEKRTSKKFTGVLNMCQVSGMGAVMALALLAAVPAFATAQVGDPTSGQCEASFNPSVLEAGTVHEEVEVSMSEHIGDVQEIETPAESGLTLLWTHADEDEPLRARVRVSAVGADPGTWSIILWGGGEETCRGNITIVDGN